MKILKRKNVNKIISILIVIVAITIFMATFKNKDIDIYTYNISQKSDYKVYINANDFLQEQYITKNNLYIADMVKYINIEFNYNYDATKYTKLDCDYDIIATLYIDYATTNQNLIKQQYDIIKEKFLKIDNYNKININESLNIDYNFYNNEVSKFKERYNLPVNAYLKIDFVVKTKINLNSNIEQIEKDAGTELTIDLNKPVFEIREQYYGNESNKITNTGENVEEPNLKIILISIIIFIIGTSSFIIKTRRDLFSKEKMYKINLNRKLKKYSEIIVELENEINLIEYKIIDVNDFEELIDVEEEIREPILYFQKEEFKSVFLILDNNISYRYILQLK